MSDSSDEEIDGSTTPYDPAARGKTHLGGNSRVYVPREVCPPAISPMDKKIDPPVTERPVTGHGSLTTGQMGSIQEFSSQSISGQRPSCHRSLDLENIYTGEVNIHRSPVIWLYINLHLWNLCHGIGFTNNNSKKNFITSSQRCNWSVWQQQDIGQQTFRFPSLVVFPGEIALEVNINPRRGGDIDRSLHPPLYPGIELCNMSITML